MNILIGPPHINHLSQKLVKANAILFKLQSNVVTIKCQFSNYQINLLCHFSCPSFIYCTAQGQNSHKLNTEKSYADN